MSETRLRINRGSDAVWRMRWGMDLTGRELSLFEPHPALVGQLSVELDGAGEAESFVVVRLDWTASMPDGAAMTFRLAADLGADRRTSQLFRVVIE